MVKKKSNGTTLPGKELVGDQDKLFRFVQCFATTNDPIESVKEAGWRPKSDRTALKKAYSLLAQDNVLKMLEEAKAQLPPHIDIPPEGQRLNARDREFCERYVIAFNRAKAYQDTPGFNPKDEKTAYSLASKKLKQDGVPEYIEALLRERRKRLTLDGDFVINEFLCIADFDVGELFWALENDERITMAVLRKMPPSFTRCIKSVKQIHDKKTGETRFELTFWSKMDALKALGEHLGITRNLDSLISIIRKYDYDVTDNRITQKEDDIEDIDDNFDI